MFAKTIGFVGGGRIVRILLGGWRRAGVTLREVVVSDVDQATLERLPSGSGPVRGVLADNLAAARQEIVFLAVHPPAMSAVADEIRGGLDREAIVVSLAPKLTLERLSAMLGGFERLVRMIPNAPSIVADGFNPVTFAGAVSAEDRDLLRQLLEPLGQMPEVAEERLEAYAVLTAMGPTYFWPQLVELQALAGEFGLSPEEARDALRQMLRGAAATLADSGMTADEVLDLVPVKPLGDLEPTLREAYRAKLTAVMEKIRP